MNNKQIFFIYVCEGGSLSFLTYLYMSGFFDFGGESSFANVVLTYGVFPSAWLLFAVQAWFVYKNRKAEQGDLLNKRDGS